MRILKAIGAAIGGYLVFALTAVALGQLSGRNLHAAQPAWFVGLTTVYGMVFAALGAILAARVAPHRGWAVTIMTSLVVAGAVGSLIASPATDARWSQWMALLFMAPSALLAPRLRVTIHEPPTTSPP
jgi:uncharacterized membrane protein YhaH (DUF805 family)